MMGAGGGGGSSKWNVDAGDELNGRQGASTIFHVNDQMLFVANGGPGGIGAYWGNGSSFSSVGGGASDAWFANHVEHPLTISKIELIDGNPGIGRMGGTPFKELTATPVGKGGEGSAPNADTTYSFGGGGASGAYIAFNLRNQSNETAKIKFTIGNGGAAGPSGNTRGAAGAPGAFCITRN